MSKWNWIISTDAEQQIRELSPTMFIKDIAVRIGVHPDAVGAFMKKHKIERRIALSKRYFAQTAGQLMRSELSFEQGKIKVIERYGGRIIYTNYAGTYCIQGTATVAGSVEGARRVIDTYTKRK